MIRKFKNIIFSLIIFLVLLLGYGINLNCAVVNYNIEISSNSGSSESNISTNCEFYDYEQLNESNGFYPIFYSDSKIQIVKKICILSQLIYTPWQPPKKLI